MDLCESFVFGTTTTSRQGKARQGNEEEWWSLVKSLDPVTCFGEVLTGSVSLLGSKDKQVMKNFCFLIVELNLRGHKWPGQNITWVQSQSTPQGGQSSSYKVWSKESAPDDADSMEAESFIIDKVWHCWGAFIYHCFKPVLEWLYCDLRSSTLLCYILCEI